MTALPPMLSSWMRPLGIVSRILAAAVGGYGLAYSASGALALTLPMARPDAVLVGAMIAFVLYTAAVLWCFAARSAVQAWLGLIGVAAPLALFAFT